jgi:cysteine synthase
MKAIGNTPLIKLEKLPEPGCAEIYVKYEGSNPIGSMKDRMALSMIEGAERRGELKSGGTVVEYTGRTTSGANVWAAIQRARIIGPGKKTVTIICDSGLKYIDGDLYRY